MTSNLNTAIKHKKPRFMVCMLAYEFISGVRNKGTKIKELAVSANQSAASTLKNVVGLSQKLLNTSTGLSKVNATLQEASELLWDSSMASMSRSPFPVGKSTLCSFELAKCTMVPCLQIAFLTTRKCTVIWIAIYEEREGPTAMHGAGAFFTYAPECQGFDH